VNGITNFIKVACKKPGVTLVLKLTAHLMIVSVPTIASDVFF
jgi:hypothetical protein